jgi:hypothetical protein
MNTSHGHFRHWPAGDAMASLLYSLAVALKAATSVLCPLLIRASNPAADWIDRHLPVRVQNALSQYDAWLDRTRKLRPTDGIERGNAAISSERSPFQ